MTIDLSPKHFAALTALAGWITQFNLPDQNAPSSPVEPEHAFLSALKEMVSGDDYQLPYFAFMCLQLLVEQMSYQSMTIRRVPMSKRIGSGSDHIEVINTNTNPSSKIGEFQIRASETAPIIDGWTLVQVEPLVIGAGTEDIYVCPHCLDSIHFTGREVSFGEIEYETGADRMVIISPQHPEESIPHMIFCNKCSGPVIVPFDIKITEVL